MKRFAFIALHADSWPVRQPCQLLGVSASGYYAWHKRRSAAAVESASPAWQVAAQRVLYDPRRTLRPAPTTCPVAARRPRSRPAAIARLAHCQRLTRLCTRVSTRPPRATQADPQAVAAANKLTTWPAATAPNQIWVGDMTYLALATGQ